MNNLTSDPHSSFLMVRHHNPSLPIKRNLLEKIGFWIFEFLVVIAVYYFLILNAHALNYLTLYGENPDLMMDFSISFWISILFLSVVSKIFKRTAVFTGAILTELGYQFLHSVKIQPILIVFLGLYVIWESLHPYKGGEYYLGQSVFKQLGYSILFLFIFLPFLFFFFNFNTPLTGTLNLTEARFFLVSIFIVHMIIIIGPHWIIFWGLDKFLSKYFPISSVEFVDSEFSKIEPSETMNSLLDNSVNTSSNHPMDRTQVIDEMITIEQDINAEEKLEDLEDYFPQPGECYEEFLTHHPLEDDDHTIVIQIGKVRVYLCTRCTAMILGAFLTFVFTFFFITEFSIFIPANIGFWLVILLPLFPIVDWGLQALKIRKANTLSRLITGFILGFAMNMLVYTDTYEFVAIAIIIGYFSIFGILSYLRKKLDRSEIDKDEIIITNSDLI